MYHTILVDDEENTINELLYLIDWSKQDIKIDALARNGEEAIQAIEKYSPDFIFCDISMPIKSGLDVLHYIKENNLRTLFIAISAYSEFRYVRTCLDEGALTYLLKTIDTEELLQAIQKAKERTDELKTGDTDTLFQNLLLSLINGRNCSFDLQQIGFPSKHPLFSLLACPLQQQDKNTSPTDHGRFTTVTITAKSMDIKLILINHDENYNVLSFASSFYPCGISKPHAGCGKLYYESTCALITLKFFKAPFCVYQKTHRNIAENLYKQLNASPSKEQAVALIQDHLKSVDELCVLQSMFDGEEETILPFDFYNLFSSLDEFVDYIFESKKTDTVPPSVLERGLEEIHDHILKNYDKNLSLSEFSKQYFISTNYLNHSFKKKYGMPINQFLISTRMKAAMKLITETNLPLQSISQLVGYSDFYYFSRIFKKHYDNIPSFFRKTQK